jgi:hypothetical protein
MLQRLALYTALGLTLSALEADFTHWAFWCVVGLFWASEHMTRSELIEQLNEELQEMRRRQANKDNTQ